MLKGIVSTLSNIPANEKITIHHININGRTLLDIQESDIESDAPNEDKIKLQQLIFDQQNKEIEAITSRWQADSMSDSWMSKNVRPLILIWCIVIFSFAGILDSVETIPFNIHSTWNDTFEKVMMAVVLAYFGGRTTEKATSIFKQKQ